MKFPCSMRAKDGYFNFREPPDNFKRNIRKVKFVKRYITVNSECKKIVLKNVKCIA